MRPSAIGLYLCLGISLGVVLAYGNLEIPCDYENYESGCEDEEGSFCEPQTQRCLCKQGYPIRLLGYCLQRKEMGDECYTTSQCNQTAANSACFIFGKEYDTERLSGGHNVGRQIPNWPTGTCRCRIGFQVENATYVAGPGKGVGERAVKIEGAGAGAGCVKRTIGSWCNEDWDCIKNTFNSQCSRHLPAVCECNWGFFYEAKTDTCTIPKLFGSKCATDAECSPEHLVCSQGPVPGRCVCPQGYHFDVIHPGCKPNDDSSCDYGYKWDEEWGRCIPARSASSAILQNQRTKSVEPTTTVFAEEGDSSPLQTACVLILPNLVAIALIGRYCYYRKRDESHEGEDVERGQIRPTETLKRNIVISPHQSGAGAATSENSDSKTRETNLENGLQPRDSLPTGAQSYSNCCSPEPQPGEKGGEGEGRPLVSDCIPSQPQQEPAPDSTPAPKQAQASQEDETQPEAVENSNDSE